MLVLVTACLARDREVLWVDGNKMVGTIPSDVIALASLTYVQLCPCKGGVITVGGVGVMTLHVTRAAEWRRCCCHVLARVPGSRLTIGGNHFSRTNELKDVTKM
jgi:hypothetical protein